MSRAAQRVGRLTTAGFVPTAQGESSPMPFRLEERSALEEMTARSLSAGQRSDPDTFGAPKPAMFVAHWH